MQQIAAKLMTKPLYLWEIRLQIVINLIEEQYLIGSLLLHLIVTFKHVYTSNGNEFLSANIPTFISTLQDTYSQNQKVFSDFIGKSRTFPEFQHLRHKWPVLDFEIN